MKVTVYFVYSVLDSDGSELIALQEL